MTKVRHVALFADEFIGGVAGELTAPELGVYSLICFLIYSHNGPIADNAASIAAKIKDATADGVRTIIDHLVTLGKLIRKGGKLFQKRCAIELERAKKIIKKNAANGLKGGRPRFKTKDLRKPNGFLLENPPRNPNRTEQSRADSEANASATQASPAVAVDSKALIFGEQLTWLTEATGKSEQATRAWLGKCCVRFGESQTLAAILTMRANPTPVEPIARMRSILEKNGGNHGGKVTPTGGLFEGAAIALAKRASDRQELERATDRGTSLDAALAFLDGGGRSTP